MPPPPIEILSGVRVISTGAHDNLSAALSQLKTGTPVEVVQGADPDVVLHLPRGDVDESELSIVVPAADEEVTVGDFVEWCKQGLDEPGSSTSWAPAGTARRARSDHRRDGPGFRLIVLGPWLGRPWRTRTRRPH